MSTTTIRMFEVGGCVRDELLGIPSKDIDFSVEAPSFDALHTHLLEHGFDVFQVRHEFLTIRGRFPRTHPQHPGVAADFVLARRDGTYSDSRRPDEVIPGTLFDDLARRDFTVNAIAKDEQGNLIDPHDGQIDLRDGILRCVGRPVDRLTEDPLRALRAIRFWITKDLNPDGDLFAALESDWLPSLVADPRLANRKRDELALCFAKDTLRTMDVLTTWITRPLRAAIFTDGLWLRPTNERP